MQEPMSQTNQDSVNDANVLRLADVDTDAVSALLAKYGVKLISVPMGEEIPGSFWGDEEAGLIGSDLLVRPDTPLHSILHETCHYICMDQGRRKGLDTDAGGDYDEENAVCFLQVLLADHIEGFDKARMFKDMDTWGYTFRLGSAQAWFERDAEDARAWLLERNLITQNLQPCWSLRKD